MFENWTIKKIVVVLGVSLLIVATAQIFLFSYTSSYILHFGMSFIALFIALVLFYSVNIRLKKTKREK